MRFFRKQIQLSPLRFIRILLAICVSVVCVIGLKTFVESDSEENNQTVTARNAVTMTTVAQHQIERLKAVDTADLRVKPNDLLDDAQYPGFIEETSTVKQGLTRSRPDNVGDVGNQRDSTRHDVRLKEVVNTGRARSIEDPNSAGAVRPFIPVNHQQLVPQGAQIQFNPAVMPLEPPNQNIAMLDYAHAGPALQPQPFSPMPVNFLQQLPTTAATSRVVIKQRIVHFDLKGAPLKLEYYKQVFPLFKKLRATGILMEYEDMFPYSGKLKSTQARNAYSKDDIRHILNLAEANELEVIPLIQTFGHLEFVLKHQEFANLREVSNFPQAVCPSRNGSFEMIKDIIDQVVEMHPNSTYLHIGADEVFQLGICPICAGKIVNNPTEGRNDLFLSHVAQILTYIRSTYPHIRPIMWDDMFHSMNSQIIQQGLGELASYVEVMIWSYYQDWTRHLPMNGDLFANVFTNFWGATAFKGSDGETRQIPNINVQSSIHTSWLDALKISGSKMKNFRGIVLTGWSRYDHFYPLCELFPTSLPSLAINLEILVDGAFTVEGAGRAFKALGCQLTPPSLAFTNYDPFLSQFMSCNFPGIDIFRMIHMVDGMTKMIHSYIDELEAKFPEYQLSAGYIQPSRIDEILGRLTSYESTLQSYIPTAQAAFVSVYDEFTLNEWIAAQILPSLRKVQHWKTAFAKTWSRSDWVSRPLDISLSEFKFVSTISPLDAAHLQGSLRNNVPLPRLPKSVVLERMVAEEQGQLAMG